MTAFSKWYSKNKDKLAQARRDRYRSDPEYRQAALDRSRRSREKVSAPTGDKTITFGEMAKMLEVSTVTLRSWKTKDYFPEPLRYRGRIAFSQDQAQLLKHLKSLFVNWNWNMSSPEAKQQLTDLVNLIYCNWE